MGNSIELITKWSSKAWDKVYKKEAISSLLDGDKDLLKFTGAKTVRIARFASSGLSDYGRPNNEHEGVFGGDGHDTSMENGGYGYQQGDASLVWEEFTLSCDRGVQLRVELMDDEETDGLAVAAATTEETRTQVIPEVDAYVFSKLVEYAGTVKTVDIALGNTLGVTGAAQPIFELNAGFLALDEAEVPAEEQIIFCSNAFFNNLRNTPELVKTLRQTEYGENVKFTIGTYEGRDIVSVPTKRFRTLIKLLRGGYGFESGSKDINFIICAKSAVYHVTKYDKVRVFSPAVVQDFDGYKINVRIYHDVFVPANKRPAIYACVSETAHGEVSEKSLAFTAAIASKKVTVSNAVLKPASALVKGYALVAEADAVVGTALPAGAVKLALDYITTNGETKMFFKQTAALSNGTYKLVGVDNGQIAVIGVGTAIVIAD